MPVTQPPRLTKEYLHLGDDFYQIIQRLGKGTHGTVLLVSEYFKSTTDSRTSKSSRSSHESQLSQETEPLINPDTDSPMVISKLPVAVIPPPKGSEKVTNYLAAKIAPSLTSHEVEREAIIYRYLQSTYPCCQFYPRLIRTGMIDSHYVLLMEAFPHCVTLTKAREIENYPKMDILYQLISSVTEMHKLGLVHQDLSANNVLVPDLSGISKGYRVKLVDFATARFTNDMNNKLALHHNEGILTTSLVISPFTAILNNPEWELPGLTELQRNTFLMITDLWSVFHLSCFLLHQKGEYFACSNELLSHLKAKRVWDSYNNPIRPYLSFNRDLFYLIPTSVEMITSHIENPLNFKPDAIGFLSRFLQILLFYNINTYKSVNYQTIYQLLFAPPPIAVTTKLPEAIDHHTLPRGKLRRHSLPAVLI